MLKFLLLTTALVAMPGAFANSNAGAMVYISFTPQPEEMSQSDFEAISNWVLIKALGNHGEAGSNTNVLTYDTWDLAVIQKSKGLTDAGSPTIEVARLPFDPGQIILRAAAKTNLNYAFRMIRNDALTVGGTGTILYNRGLVMGPTRPFGRNEDFDLEVFTVGLQQMEIVVDPTQAGTAPTLTVNPAITGTPTVGQVLTVSNGTFTGTATITYSYQWFAGGVPIAGAVNNTYFLTPAETGKIITARVRAANVAGYAYGTSAATTAVAS